MSSPKALVDSMVALLDHADPAVQRSAAQYLRQFADRGEMELLKRSGAFEALVRFYQDPNTHSEAKLAAMWALLPVAEPIASLQTDRVQAVFLHSPVDSGASPTLERNA